MMRNTISLMVAIAALLASAWASPALAEDGGGKEEKKEESDRFSGKNWPKSLAQRPLVLAPFMVELRGDFFRIDMSSGSIGDPVSMAPDLFVGVTKHTTVGIVQEIGYCVSGDGCSGRYNDVGIEAIRSLTYGGIFELAWRATWVMNPLDPFTSGVKMGIRARLGGGQFALRLDPNIYVGLFNRDGDGTPENPGRAEGIDVPIELQFQVSEQNAAFFSTGISGPLKNFAEANQVPIGLGGLFALGHRFDVGAEFRFTNLLGQGGGISGRLLLMRLAVRI